MTILDRDEPFQRYTLTVQKVGALSPADKLRAAEARIAELESQLYSATQVAEAGRFEKFSPERLAVLPEDCTGQLEIKTSYERAHGI